MLVEYVKNRMGSDVGSLGVILYKPMAYRTICTCTMQGLFSENIVFYKIQNDPQSTQFCQPHWRHIAEHIFARSIEIKLSMQSRS